MTPIDLKDLTFLVIDDNNHMLSIIKTMLRGFGAHRIREAHDAESGLEELNRYPIDAVIVDYALETLNGIEFTQLVRSARDSGNRYVPIIMLTAYTERRRVEQARDAGVTEFLKKPVCARDLYERVFEVVMHPRPFVKTATYFGPDRRRKNDPNYKGPERRQTGTQFVDEPRS
ncbi:MAG: response regulator [Hyphomicrobiales bacterium]